MKVKIFTDLIVLCFGSLIATYKAAPKKASRNAISNPPNILGFAVKTEVEVIIILENRQ